MAEQGKHGIAWTEVTWNPIVGCSKALRPGPNGKPVLRQGCAHCYAIDAAATPRLQQFEQYKGLVVLNNRRAEWTGKVNFVEHKLDEPRGWKKPRMIFVNSMSDLFHESVKIEWIERILQVVADCPQHIFQILTKRPERMQKVMSQLGSFKIDGRKAVCIFDGKITVLKNLWLGVSVEDQGSADYAIPLLLATPAAVRWISAEPLLGLLRLMAYLRCNCGVDPDNDQYAPPWGHATNCPYRARLHWVVVGGESGSRARPTTTDFVRRVVADCKDAGVAVFVKQLGSNPVTQHGPQVRLTDRKGGNMAEWPLALRVREFPEVQNGRP